MSANKYLPHLLILPEDDATRQLANGFVFEFPTRQIQILPVAGGWSVALDLVINQYFLYLRNHPDALLAVIIDFDGQADRLQLALGRVPPSILDRVFIVGALDEAERLRRAGLGSFETIGRALARECKQGETMAWRHRQLQHNLPELERLRVRAGFLLDL